MHAGPQFPPVVPDTEECWATVAGHRMRYLRSGNGPPVLLIHGLMAYSFSWRYTIPALAPIRTVYAPDLLGTGFSDHPMDLEYSVRAAAERMWEFLDGIAIQQLDLIGSSLGGGIAVRMTASAPDRVNKLALAAPVNPWSRHGRVMTRTLATTAGARMFLRMVPLIRATGRVWLKRLFGDPKRLRPGTLEGYGAALEGDEGWKYGLDVMRNWRADMRQLEQDYVALAGKPVLLIWGDRDAAVSPRSARAILHRMTHARLEMMKTVGHIPYDEVPDNFNLMLVDFLSE